MYKERGNACHGDLQKSFPPLPVFLPCFEDAINLGGYEALTFCFGCSMSHRRIEMGQWRHA